MSEVSFTPHAAGLLWLCKCPPGGCRIGSGQHVHRGRKWGWSDRGPHPDYSTLMFSAPQHFWWCFFCLETYFTVFLKKSPEMTCPPTSIFSHFIVKIKFIKKIEKKHSTTHNFFYTCLFSYFNMPKQQFWLFFCDINLTFRWSWRL